MKTNSPVLVLSLCAVALATASGCIGGSASDEPVSDLSSAVTTTSIADLAHANLGKGACSENSRGSRAFDSSCTGNGGEPEYWCADFARWVWTKAGAADTDELDAAAGSFYTYGERHHTLSGNPRVGDAVVFDYHGGGVADHVAIVTQVNANGTIETVSGDWGGQSGSEAHFSSTSHVVLNAPAYHGAIGSRPAIMGMTISGFVSPVGLESPPPAKPPTGCGLLDPGHELTAGESLASCDGHHELSMQTDGNLVVYHEGHATWSSKTNGKGGHRAAMQSDGNFMLYNAASKSLWTSDTAGHAGAYLAMQDDGNLVVYTGTHALWASGTNGK
jgi:hypothetical protein